MLSSMLLAAVARLEHRFGVTLEHLRDLVRASPVAFFKLLLFGPVAQHRRTLPGAAFHLARIAATQVEDCDACLRIALHYARRDGLDPSLLSAAVHRDPARLSAEQQAVLQFAATVAGGGDDPILRETLRRLYGETAVVELALVIATTRVFPTFKRALGHATACRRIS